MIRISRLHLMRGSKPLFESADLTIHPGERVGLIGANGAGKSTLFAMLKRELHADGGDFDMPASWRIAHVAQSTPALQTSALDYAMDGDVHLRSLQRRLNALETLSQAEQQAHGLELANLHTQLADADAYTAQSRAEQLLLGLGFSMQQMGQPVASFSGGWRMRLNLAQALMCPSDLLLLDEPTNHLDLDAILWLEDWLGRYPGTLLVISHDRDFLDGVAQVTVHIHERKLRRYSGNYSAFERQRAAQLELAAAQYEKQQRQRAHLQSFIDRFKAKATKAKQAQSRVKALARMEELAPLHAAAEFSFEFREPDNAPNPLLRMETVQAGYRSESGDTPIVSRIDFALQLGMRIGLLGVNGAGKSTLIKTIAGEIAPLSGQLTLGKGLTVGYFAQHQLEMLREDDSPLQHLVRIAPQAREQDLRNFLGSFLFQGEMATSPVKPFSGGEKARLALALIVWQKPNLLLLDEPTNHLDLETREALTMALAQFDGTLILVSHDRHLLRACTDQFMIVAEHRLQEFDGDLDDYRDWLFKTRLAKAAAQQVEKEGGADRREQKRLEAEQRQRLSVLKKPIENKLKKIETAMTRAQEQKAPLDAELAGSEIYDPARKERLKQILAQQAQLARELETLEMEWLEQQQALEDLLQQP
ncbi:ATP-binding cassette domain-containing protein [Massilia sp. W12]|uniref:ATP-binding cassette domain-containing protein n=1 Tax=Massilia sp. W12 TaxID=3126507 RepID=UPI0030CCAA69